MFETPILYLIFNRPELTVISFSSISKIKPKKLFIAADGPREFNHLDEINCIKSREYVLSNIDWECEVHTLFRSQNSGCGKAVSSAITWFFNHVEEGIIIEDDCVPDTSFFTYCAEILDCYRENNNVYHINGSNHQFGIKRGCSDYYFSVYPHVWGWATWRRAWIHYDYEMFNFYELANTEKFKRFAPLQLMYEVKVGIVDTWDIQWVYSVMKNNGIVITPNVNLVNNIGFNNQATHTGSSLPDFVRLSKNGSISNDIKHLSVIRINRAADDFTALFVHKIQKPKMTDLLMKKVYRKFNKIFNF